MTATAEPAAGSTTGSTTGQADDVMERLIAARDADRRGEDPRPGPREHERFLVLLTDPNMSEELFGGRDDIGLILLRDHLFDGGVDSLKEATDWVIDQCGYRVEPVEWSGWPFHWTFRPADPV